MVDDVRQPPAAGEEALPPPEQQQVEMDSEAARIDAAMAVFDVPDEEASPPAVEETPAEEAPAAEETPPSPKEEKVSRLWARIAQQDRELVELRRMVKQQGGGASMEDLKARAASDPAGVMRDLGMGFDQILDAVSGPGFAPDFGDDDQVDPTPGPSPEIEELRKEIETMKQDRQMRQHQAVMHQEIEKIKGIADSDPDRWELVRMNGNYHGILESAAKMYNDSGGIAPDYEILLDTYEEWHEGQLKEQAERLRSAKKAVRLMGLPDGSVPAPAPGATMQDSTPVQVASGHPSAATGVPKWDEEAAMARALKILEEE